MGYYKSVLSDKIPIVAPTAALLALANLYTLPKGVLIGILFLNIGRLTGSNYKKNYPAGSKTPADRKAL